MLPDQEITLTPDYDETEQPPKELPSLTYRLSEERIVGKVDGLTAIKQAIWKRLMTEKAVYDIYDDTYGLQTVDLIGKEYGYVVSKIQRRIKETLLNDDRITDVSNFQFRKGKDYIWVGFDVTTTFGQISGEFQLDERGQRR